MATNVYCSSVLLETVKGVLCVYVSVIRVSRVFLRFIRALAFFHLYMGKTKLDSDNEDFKKTGSYFRLIGHLQ